MAANQINSDALLAALTEERHAITLEAVAEDLERAGIPATATRRTATRRTATRRTATRRTATRRTATRRTAARARLTATQIRAGERPH